MESTVKIKMTLNRLIKLKAQIIDAVREAKSQLEATQECTVLVINKWSKPTLVLVDHVLEKRVATLRALDKYNAFLYALTHVKETIYKTNLELGIFKHLLDLEMFKALLSTMTALYNRIPNDIEVTNDIARIENIIAEVKTSIQNVEGSEAYDRLSFVAIDVKFLSKEILSIKRLINIAEDEKVRLNSTEVEIELTEDVVKSLGLV